MKIDTKFNLGQIVYLVTDTEQLKRIVVCIEVMGGGGHVLYGLSQGTTYTRHYESEISDQVDVVYKTSN